MRRISRIQRPIGLFKNQSNACILSLHLCPACKNQITFFSTSSSLTASNEKVPYTEKIRQRIWGTDKPPGLEDPYGYASVFDQSKQRVPEHELEARKQEPKQEAEEKSKTEDRVGVEGGYEPATSIETLRWVGGDPMWWPEEDFKGFLPSDSTKSSARITAALHRSMVEAFGLQQVGVSLHVISALPTWMSGRWTDNAQLIPSPTGAILEMKDISSLQATLQSLRTPATLEEENEVEPTESQEDVIADRSEVDPLKEDAVVPSPDPHDPTSGKGKPTGSEEDVTADRSEEDPLAAENESRNLKAAIASWDPAWLQISLESPEVKFAVMKRTMQLTGIRFPDAAIKSTNTAKSLLNHLITPPKPRKLVEALQQKQDLYKLKNVTVRPKRYGFIDKEKDIGRLKTILRELDARGLPISPSERWALHRGR